MPASIPAMARVSLLLGSMTGIWIKGIQDMASRAFVKGVLIAISDEVYQILLRTYVGQDFMLGVGLWGGGHFHSGRFSSYETMFT